MLSILLYAFIASSILGISLYTVDVLTTNSDIPSLMKLVWALTILYSGLFGLTLYWYSGRKQISTDSLYRRGVRSTAHCYSGCGLGEIVGLTLAVGILSGSVPIIVFCTFFFAYLFGFSLTIGPLMQDGESFIVALKDTISTETLSIFVMEVAAITADLYVIGGRPQTLTSPIFWVALFASLTVGFIVAYPVNVELIRRGVKSGMMNPQHY